MIKMRKLILFINLLLCLPLLAQENLDRGMVAYRSIEGTNRYVCLSWRHLSSDDPAIAYNLYKANVSSGVPGEYSKLNDIPISNSTFFKYEEKRQLAVDYILKEVVNEVEGDSIASYRLKSVSDGAKGNYIEIPMTQIEGDDDWLYHPNDATVADLDGDGEMEIIIHRYGTGHDNSHSGITTAPILQAYKLDGTFLWEVNLGVNIREGSHYTQFMVYDLDGDGKAEVVCKTAEGAKDAAGTWVGKAYWPTYQYRYNITAKYNENAVYRNSNGQIITGPEFLTVFNGETGEEIVTTEYDPPRYSTSIINGNEIPKLNPTTSEINSRWGDNYGGRSERYLAGVAYLGGENYSVIMCRGYYTRTVLVAYDYKNGSLTRRWKFDTYNNTTNSAYIGQGNHNLRIADVDGDGFDEIIYGACVIDHDGTGLYSTGFGHGDADHLTDFLPERPGLEILACHESTAANAEGTTLRDARTGEVIHRVKSSDDVGRCMGTDIDPNHRGMEWWSSRSGGIRNAKGEVIDSSTSAVGMNMACWWDGDLLRELQSGTEVSKYDYTTKKKVVLLDASADCSGNNSTKNTPCLQADVLGDWREEVIVKTSDHKAIRIYMTPYPTDYRFHTFLEDPVYRMSVVYQNVGYNQPTHTGFYIGSDLEDIFPETHIEISGDSHTIDPYFDAVAYQWSTGDETKTVTLNRADYQAGVKHELALALNFRGHVFTDTLFFTFTGGSGIGDYLDNDSNLRYNNPVYDDLVLSGVNGTYDITVHSMAGLLSYAQAGVELSESSPYRINMSGASSGFYILTLKNAQVNKTYKFFKY